MSFDYTQVTNELFSKIKAEHFNKNNEKHMKVLEEILSKHIEDEELFSMEWRECWKNAFLTNRLVP